MKKVLTILLALLIVSPSLLKAQDEDEVKMKINGVYTAWGLTQNNFKFGAADYQDDYFVQMFRLNLQFCYKDRVKAITRMDLGQGWWGVDNVSPSYNGASGLFDNKDTHYFLHVDHAYLWFNVPEIKTAFNVGRFNWSVGNKMILDNNLDGIDANIALGDGTLKLGWAKVSEGMNGLSDNGKIGGADPRGNTDNRDADLYMAQYKTKIKETNLEFYGAFYKDRSIDDNTAYLIDGLYFNRPRFTPQVTQAMVFGIAGDSKMDKLSVTYEANYLVGKDDIANITHAGVQNVPFGGNDALKYDINNGDLSGYNVYVKANYAVSDKVSVGAVAGMGSGDDDPTQGEGNINKLRTSGFFYLTEIWEDSIMPDEEGITPQGLGAPNIRGYRELENTTALQLNATFKPMKKLSLFTSFTYLKATQPIYAWTAAGPDLTKSADDIGWEFDVKADYSINEKLGVGVRGGYFQPGTGGAYLVNGNDTFDDGAWEIKSTITFKF